jgi:hypothetical protein
MSFLFNLLPMFPLTANSEFISLAPLLFAMQGSFTSIRAGQFQSHVTSCDRAAIFKRQNIVKEFFDERRCKGYLS